MIIACPACATRYVVPDSAIGVDGRTVRCAKCRHSWFQEGPDLGLAMPDAPVSAPPRAAPPPVPPAAENAPEQAEERQTEQVFADPPSPDTDADTDSDADTGIRGPIPPSAEPPAAEAADEPPVSTPPQTYYDDIAQGHYQDEDRSRFDFEPPFRPRRNPARMWTLAAALFAVVTLTTTAAVWWYGLPDWAPITRPTFAEAQPDLVLDFPAPRQDRRTLPNGAEYFGASGTVTNVGQTRRTVPSILIVLRDAGDRIVYTTVVNPPKRQLAPGESVTINEAVTNVPRSAIAAEIGWKPG